MKPIEPVIYLEHVCCDFCGSLKYRVRYRKPDTWLWLNQYEYVVVECAECGLVYINPRPTLESMAHFYPPGFHENRDNEKFQKQYEIQAEFIPALTNERVLDIGCARGDWLAHLKGRYPGIHCTGADFYSERVSYPYIEFHRALLPDCNLPESSFDIATAWAVFEHLHHPGAYFGSTARLLKPGGKLIFLVTNADSLYGRRANKEDTPRHLHHFSKKSLERYAEKFGFEMTRIAWDDRIWDGRGDGTFYHLFTGWLGLNWEKRYFNEVGFLRTLAGRFGRFMDRCIFSGHWEARRHQSGIIICEFTRKSGSPPGMKQ